MNVQKPGEGGVGPMKAMERRFPTNEKRGKT